jgi:type IV pilus assembly protein PilF
MKNLRLLIIIALIIIGSGLSIIACAPTTNKDNLKRQADASRNLGEVYMDQGQYTAALKELLEAEQKYPNDPMINNSLGLAYLAKERPDLAVDHFKKAIKLKPDFSSAVNNLGNAYLRLKQWDAAIEQFHSLSDDLIYATPHYPLTNIGFAYYNKGEFKNAEKYYQEALKLQPKFIIALRGLGRTYLQMGDVAKAQEVLFEAIAIEPDFTPAYMDLAKSYLMTEETEKAKNAYQHVIRTAPESPIAKEAQKALEELSP